MQERRSTGLKDLDGNEILESCIIEQEHTDKPYSKHAKKKWIRGLVKFVEADPERKTVGGYAINVAPHWTVDFSIDPEADRYQCFSWSPFFRCRVVGRIA